MNIFMKENLKNISIIVKSLPYKALDSFVAIFSIACISAVMLSVLTLLSGMKKTMENSGLATTVIAMRAGSNSELQSVLFPNEIDIMLNHPNSIRDEFDKPIHSSEMYVNAEVHINDADPFNVSLRGLGAQATLMRPNFKIESGRFFEPGLREIVVGKAVVRKNPDIKLGSLIKLGGVEWKVVGIFSDKLSVFESEIWADLKTVQADYKRGASVQSVRIAFSANTSVEELYKTWKADPRLNVSVESERVYFLKQSESLTRLMRWVGIPLAIIMAFGATIAALNTMYASVSGRMSEIGIQKAIGFSVSSIAISVVFEAVLLAAIGGVLGIVPLYFLLNDITTSTNSAASLSQVMFNFSISSELMFVALGFAILIGILGSLLPALYAIRVPVTHAIRMH